ncbi:JAB domain-containing protein [Sediminibacterium soli]|uniref:JAB domain-containing protein n=1 Tax=Sediminibacterium soli TaxID=2698829 RepID=UPI00137B1D41|nr:JAB domain-containing protein [Sediminibacterium soli]NCI45791.1 JAB domain-containing protein [Sediminibacterium soli]
MNIRLKKEEQIKIGSTDDMYAIMQRILLRENKVDRNREHLWTISLDNAGKILNIELVSMGSINRTIIEPMEVYSVPLQKRAVKIIVVHNHPSGELRPSQADKDMTEKLIQCGLILHVPVLDHLIITENKYYSFADSGLLHELANGKRYVPEYKIREELRREVEGVAMEKGGEKKAMEMARVMKAKGYDVKEIAALTGLTEAVIKRIKEEGI